MRHAAGRPEPAEPARRQLRRRGRLEHYAGNLPLWLAPLQVVVATITSDGDDYAVRLVEALREAGIEAETDLRNEKIGYKVREHSLAKIPVIMAVGKREVEEDTVAIRRLGSKGQKVAPRADAIAALREEIVSRVTTVNVVD